MYKLILFILLSSTIFSTSDGTNIRCLRLGVIGKAFEDWSYKCEAYWTEVIIGQQDLLTIRAQIYL